MNLQEGADLIRKGELLAVPIRNGAIVLGLAAENGISNVPKAGKLVRDRFILIDSERRLFQIFDEVPDIAWDLMEQTKNQIIVELANPKGIDVKWLEMDGSLRFKFTNNLDLKKLIGRVNGPIICFRFNHISDAEAHLNTAEYVLNLQAELPDEGMQLLPVIKLDQSANIQIVRS